MSTISTLAVKVSMNAMGFNLGASQMAGALANIAGQSGMANKSLKETAMSAAEAGSMFEKATRNAKNYWRAASGGAIGGISLARAIKAGAVQEKQENARMRASGDGTKNIVGVSDAWAKLAKTVDKAFAAFGYAFNKSSGLSNFLMKVAGTMEKFLPLLELAGQMFGYVVGMILKMSEVLIPVIAAIHVLIPAFALLGKLILAMAVNALIKWLIGFNTWTIISTIATYAYAVALGVASAAMALLRAISGPVWLIIGAAVMIAVGAIWVFWHAIKLVLWPFIEAWKWLTGTPATIDTSSIQGSAEDFTAARDAAQGLADTLQNDVWRYGWSEQKKQLTDYVNELNKVGDMANDERQARIESFKANQQTLQVLEQQTAAFAKYKKDREDVEAIEKRVAQHGMSEREKTLDNMRRAGAGDDLIGRANQALYIEERKNALAEKEKQLAEDAAKAQKEAADQAAEAAKKRLEDAKQWRQSIIDQGKAMKESVMTPLEKYQAKLAEITKLLALGAINPVTAMRAADLAAKEMKDGFDASVKEVASPQALLKGTAEAALAENRAKSPIDKLTDIQRQQLAKMGEQKAAFDTLAEFIKRGQAIIATITGS